MDPDVDETARVVDSAVGRSEVREYATIHDAEIGDGCRIYERVSIKKCRIDGDVDVNAGSYLENATVDSGVQIGPNSSVVGVTHELSEEGMTFREDVFERTVLGEGVFLGAGVTVGPGVEIGPRTVVAAGTTVTDDVGAGQVVLGVPPDQRVVDLEEWTDD